MRVQHVSSTPRRAEARTSRALTARVGWSIVTLRQTRGGADAPIGIFDSGVGGLTVARAVSSQLPRESILYIGDTAHSPYGPKPIADVRRYGLEVLFPIFYLSLLLPALRGEQGSQARATAALASSVTLVLIPIAPVGVPVLAAAAAALIGLRR